MGNGIEYCLDELDDPDAVFDAIKEKMIQNEDDDDAKEFKFKMRDEGGLTWANQKVYAKDEGGRLLRLEEAREILEEHGALCPGEDQWAAVKNPDGDDGRDWVQVGDA